MTGLLLAFWAAFALAMVSPGPSFALMLGTALRDGRAAAVRVALGMAAGEALWGLAAVFGVAALAAGRPWVETLLQIGGGAFLLWLAAGSARAALKESPGATAVPAADDGPDRGRRRRGFRAGFVLMLLNAKAGMFWVSLTSLFLGDAMTAPIGLLAVTGAVALSLGWHLALARALSAAVVIRAYARLRRGIEAALGAVLGALGLRLILTA